MYVKESLNLLKKNDKFDIKYIPNKQKLFYISKKHKLIRKHQITYIWEKNNNSYFKLLIPLKYTQTLTIN